MPVEIISFCDESDKAIRLGKKYYVATETDFKKNLENGLSSLYCGKEFNQNGNYAALLLGNSYILSTIASLPDAIQTIYHCDIDKDVLIYATQLIQCVKDSENFEAFKEKLQKININYKEVLAVQSKYYKNYDEWVNDRILEAKQFNACKEKINKINVQYREINLFKRNQVERLVNSVEANMQKIVLINLSNLQQFDKDSKLVN